MPGMGIPNVSGAVGSIANASTALPPAAAPNYLAGNAQAPHESVIALQQPAKVKKGVKRKADTTTPTANSFEPYAALDSSKSAKITTRRESGRQVNEELSAYLFLNSKYIPFNKSFSAWSSKHTGRAMGK